MLHLSPSQPDGNAHAPKRKAAGTANVANSLKLNSNSTPRARRTVGKSNVSKGQSVCPAEAKPIVVVSEIFIKNQFLFIYYLNVNMMNTRKVDSHQGEETIIKTELRNIL